MFSQDPGSETQFILIVFLIAVAVFGLMLIGVLIAALPQIRSRGKPLQRSYTEMLSSASEETTSEATTSAAGTASDIEREPLGEVLPVMPAPLNPELTLPSPLTEHIESTNEQDREISNTNTPIRQILWIVLTSLLMVAPVLAVLRFLSILMFFLAPLFLPIFAALTGIWIPLVGAIGLRMARLSWRQTVLAAFLAGAAFLTIAGIILGRMGSLDGIVFLLLSGGMIWFSGGVFLLPLFDPAVRRMGTAPPLRRVARIALIPAVIFLALVVISVVRAGPHPASESLPAIDQFGWVFFTAFRFELILVILPVTIALGVGLIYTLSTPSDIENPILQGSLIGGAGLLYFIFTLVDLLVVAAVATLFRM